MKKNKFRSVKEQLEASKETVKDSALEKLIQDNQDVDMLRQEEDE